MKLLFITLFLIYSHQAWSASLSAPYDLENTSVLPKGVNNTRLRGIWVQMSDSFNGNGRIEPVGAKLNKAVTWEKVIKSQDESLRPVARASINSMCEKDINCAEKGNGPGQTTGDLQINVNVTVPTYVRGLTDQTSFILAVPVYSIDVKVQTGFDPSVAFNRWVSTFKNDPFQQDKIKKKFVDPANTKAAENNYKPVQNRTIQEIGDIKVGGKTAWTPEGENMRYAVKYLLSLPTGTPPDEDQLIDVPTGDGGYSMNVIGVAEYVVTGNFSLLTTASYNYQFADTLVRRIPIDADDSISPDKERVDRKRGDQYGLGASFLAGQSTKGLSGGLGYNLQYMESTKFSGSKYENARYGYLDDLNPSQTMQSATLMMQYSTIGAFKEKLFAVPLTVSLAYSNVFAGRNVPQSDLVTSELLLFF